MVWLGFLPAPHRNGQGRQTATEHHEGGRLRSRDAASAQIARQAAAVRPDKAGLAVTASLPVDDIRHEQGLDATALAWDKRRGGDARYADSELQRSWVWIAGAIATAVLTWTGSA